MTSTISRDVLGSGKLTPLAQNQSDWLETFDSPLFSSRYSMRISFWAQSSFLACKIMLRAGPVTIFQFRNLQKQSSSKRQKQVGFSLALSIRLPRCFRHKVEVTLFLVQKAVTAQIETALHWNLGLPRIIPFDAKILEYVRDASIQEILHLLRAGAASIKDCTTLGVTLLHIASESGNLELVRLLIREGADVNALDEDGETPLHGAISINNYDIAELLMESGADMSNTTPDGKTPLHGLFNKTVGKLLMKKKEWIDDILPDSEGLSITHMLAWSSQSTLEDFLHGRSHDTTELWSTDDLSRNCLHFAAARGNIEILSYLLQRASFNDIAAKDYQGRTPLHYAVQSSKAADVVDLLIANGCRPDAIDNHGQNLLYCAAFWNNLHVIEKLMASPYIRDLLLHADKDGNLPSKLVCRKRESLLHEYLKSLESCIPPEKMVRSRPASPPARRFDMGLGVLSRKVIMAMMALLFVISLAVLAAW